MYNPFSRAALYVGAGLTGVAVLWSWFQNKQGENAGILLLIALFELSGVLGFTIMPTGVSNEGRELIWQDRKVMISYLIAAAIVAIVVSRRVEKWRVLTIPRAVQVAVAVSLIIGAPFLSQLWNAHWPVGMPGYERVKNLEATNVYRWVQEQPDNQRIYSSGLRPWGLYGRDLNNRVFYDLHSHILEQHGPERVLAVLQQFHPQLILISVDPHDYTGAAKKPSVVDWLRSQPYFTEIYNDQTVSGFAVKDGWQQLLNQYKVVPVSMKG